MTRTVLPFARRTRQSARPSWPHPLDHTSIAGLLRRIGATYPELLPWLVDVVECPCELRELQCVPIGDDLIVFVSPPLEMAKAAIDVEDHEQRA